MTLLRLVGIATQPSETVIARSFAHAGKDIHHVIVVLEIAPDGGANRASETTEKKVPSLVALALATPNERSLVHGTSDAACGLDRPSKVALRTAAAAFRVAL